MTTIGIDPGLSGAIAWTENGTASFQKMPETPRDIWVLLGRIIREAPQGRVFAYLEQVGPMPKQSPNSMFTFGRGYGGLEMALIGWEIPFERVTPQKWQKAMSCRTGGDKNVSKAKAQELFPSLKITHANADALLIAEYGRRTQLQITEQV